MSNFGNNPSLSHGNHGNYNIVTNENGDAVRVPRDQHQDGNPTIGTNENGDLARAPEEPNKGNAHPQDNTKKYEIIIHFTANARKHKFEVMTTTTVGQLMDMIEKQLDVAKGQQKLEYAGKNLAAHETLSQHNIHKGATIDLVVRVRGG